MSAASALCGGICGLKFSYYYRLSDGIEVPSDTPPTRSEHKIFLMIPYP